ncbi:hypothetical protein BC332_16354 [Capsicum chinense]|nr:hypothetical protein BC332_16354 [Capsicum chinense]
MGSGKLGDSGVVALTAKIMMAVIAFLFFVVVLMSISTTASRREEIETEIVHLFAAFTDGVFGINSRAVHVTFFDCLLDLELLSLFIFELGVGGSSM